MNKYAKYYYICISIMWSMYVLVEQAYKVCSHEVSICKANVLK